MIWLTWRQFRVQAAVVFGGIAVLAAALAATGPQLAHRYRIEGNSFLNGVGSTDTGLYVVGLLAVLAVPVLIGMFWGAPMVTRELDAGTHRLAWTMTTRTRWLAGKFCLIGVAATTAAGLLSLAVSWWANPIDEAVAARDGRPGPGVFLFPRLSPVVFDARGIVPLGYAVFAFVLGVTLGVLVRRTLPAMALLLASFIAVQVVMGMAVRPDLITPEQLTTTIDAANLTFIGISGNVSVTIDEPGAWVTAQHTVDAAGQATSPPSWVGDCLGSGPGHANPSCFAKLAAQGYRQLVSYQPADRFWSFQAYETAIYVGLALVLAGICAWWVRRRPS